MAKNIPDNVKIYIREHPKPIGGALLLADDGEFVNTIMHRGEKSTQAIAQYKLLQQMGELREPTHQRTFLNKKLLLESDILPDELDTDDLPEDIDLDDLPEELKDFLEQMFGDRFGTGGHHVATTLEGKTGWREGALTERGDDPLGDRDYKGHEFQRLLGFGPKQGGKDAHPAFWSHFTKIDKETGEPLLDENGEQIPIDCIEDLEGQKFKICLASELPPHLKNHPVLEDVENMHETGDGHDHGHEKIGPEGEETAFAPTSFTHVHPRLEKVIREFAAISANSGMEVEIVDKPEDAHVTVMGFERGDLHPRLLGIASFPEDMNNWPRLDGLGQPRGKGFAFLNNDYANLDHVTDLELERLFEHECARGHNMGKCHPHDLGNPDMSQAATHAYTLMAYADMHAGEIPGTDELHVGAVDAYARGWIPNPKPVNQGDGKVYDMQAHTEASFEANKDKSSARASGLLPAAAIVDHGTNTELHGTAGNDYIDTNPGYTSTATKEVTDEATGRTTVLKQKFLLSEGHIAKIKGIAGDNIIVASDVGDQVIEPGSGNNEIRFIHDGLNSNKTIISEGKDTLVLRMDSDKKLVAREVGGKLTIAGDKGAITLEGNGIAAIRVIDKRGKELANVDVHGLSAQQINEQVMAPAHQSLAIAEQIAKGPSGHGGFAERSVAGMGGRY